MSGRSYLEKTNVCAFLRPFEWKIREVFEREGTARATTYVLKMFGIRLRGRELREFLGVQRDVGARYAREVHRLAWVSAGWRGEYSPLGFQHGDDKRLDLISSGLLRSGEKLNVDRAK